MLGGPRGLSASVMLAPCNGGSLGLRTQGLGEGNEQVWTGSCVPIAAPSILPTVHCLMRQALSSQSVDEAVEVQTGNQHVQGHTTTGKQSRI